MTLLCWQCNQILVEKLEDAPPRQLQCAVCRSITPCEDGIYKSLSEEQQQTYQQFVHEYELIRTSEGRGSLDDSYYRALPYKDLTGKLDQQWKIRARTFDYIQRHILPRSSSSILDLGSGNGWLSYRLTLQGHKPVAVDLLTNALDGLGAGKHYPLPFPRIQASVNRLPLPSGAFDLVLFNASFHYSENYEQTLREALRCTHKGGSVVIADTPWYANENSGLEMVAEKQSRFLSTYGFASNSVPSQEFLTPQRLDSLAKALGLKWTIHKPYYGVSWALRPLKAKLRHRRTPSRFHIFVARVAA